MLAAALNAGDPAAEAQLAERLRSLRGEEDTPERRALVSQYLDYVERDRQPHPENPAHTLPRHGIQALARAQLRRWDRAAALAALDADPSSVAAKARTTDPDLLRDWIRQADEAAFARFVAGLALGEIPEPVLLAILERQPTPTWWRALARHGRSAASLKQIAAARATLQTDDYRDLLAVAASNPHLRSGVAVLQGQLAQDDAASARSLRRALAQNPLTIRLVNRGLAAELPDLADLLESRLLEPDSAPAAAWGLWRLGTPASRAALRRYRDSEAALGHLRKELDAWLD